MIKNRYSKLTPAAPTSQHSDKHEKQRDFFSVGAVFNSISNNFDVIPIKDIIDL